MCIFFNPLLNGLSERGRDPEQILRDVFLLHISYRGGKLAITTYSQVKRKFAQSQNACAVKGSIYDPMYGGLERHKIQWMATYTHWQFLTVGQSISVES